MSEEMDETLEADGKKLRSLTGKEHGPFCQHCFGYGMVRYSDDEEEDNCPYCYGTGLHNRLND